MENFSSFLIDQTCADSDGQLSSIRCTPEDIPEIQPGGIYSVRITANASTFSEADGCPSQPSESASDLADKPVCENAKPVFTVASQNPVCIDAGDTLKIKGMIDIDSHSSANWINI